MDPETAEKVNKLARSLKNHGLVINLGEGVKLAINILERQKEVPDADIGVKEESYRDKGRGEKTIREVMGIKEPPKEAEEEPQEEITEETVEDNEGVVPQVSGEDRAEPEEKEKKEKEEQEQPEEEEKEEPKEADDEPEQEENVNNSEEEQKSHDAD